MQSGRVKAARLCQWVVRDEAGETERGDMGVWEGVKLGGDILTGIFGGDF